MAIRSHGAYFFHLFWGVYSSFAEAGRAAPKTKPLGYDQPDSANIFFDRLNRIFPYDYPVLFWLRPLLAPGLRVFDIGGHIGIHFYAYRSYLNYPADLTWQVCDVPSIAKAGAERAQQEGVPDLIFTSELNDLAGADVVMAAGALQYIDVHLAEILAKMERKPRHLLLNKLPLYDGPTYVTLQNCSTFFAPQRVYNRTEYIAAFAQLGYELVDQ